MANPEALAIADGLKIFADYTDHMNLGNFDAALLKAVKCKYHYQCAYRQTEHAYEMANMGIAIGGPSLFENDLIRPTNYLRQSVIKLDDATAALSLTLEPSRLILTSAQIAIDLGQPTLSSELVGIARTKIDVAVAMADFSDTGFQEARDLVRARPQTVVSNGDTHIDLRWLDPINL